MSGRRGNRIEWLFPGLTVLFLSIALHVWTMSGEERKRIEWLFPVLTVLFLPTAPDA